MKTDAIETDLRCDDCGTPVRCQKCVQASLEYKFVVVYNGGHDDAKVTACLNEHASDGWKPSDPALTVERYESITRDNIVTHNSCLHVSVMFSREKVST